MKINVYYNDSQTKQKLDLMQRTKILVTYISDRGSLRTWLHLVKTQFDWFYETFCVVGDCNSRQWNDVGHRTGLGFALHKLKLDMSK